MEQRKSRLLFDPVWLLFIPPLFGRGFLLMRMIAIAPEGSWMVYAANALLLLMLVLVTWHGAGRLAETARLSERGTERFMVMATLGALTPPLGIAVAEFSGQIDFTATLVVMLGLFFAFFSLAQRRFFLLAVIPAMITGYILALCWPLNSGFAVQIVLNVADKQIRSAGVLSAIQLFSLAIIVVGVIIAVGSFILTFWQKHPILMRLFRLTSFLLFFCICVTMTGIIWSLAHSGALDVSIGYVEVLATTVPFFNAALFALPYMITQYRAQRDEEWGEAMSKKPERIVIVLHVIFLVLIGLYFCGQMYSYIVSPL